jgi:hypothetical protein
MVAHACHPGYSGGREQEDRGLKPAQANNSQDPILKIPNAKKKKWGGGWWTGSSDEHPVQLSHWVPLANGFREGSEKPFIPVAALR